MRHLPFVERTHIMNGVHQRGVYLGIKYLVRLLDFLPAHTQPLRCKLHGIETSRKLDQRLVTAFTHGLHNRAHAPGEFINLQFRAT